MKRLALACLLACSFALSASAQTTPRFFGATFLDFVYYADSPNDALRNETGFTFRRIHLGADVDLGGDFSGRFRLEAHQGTTDNRGATFYVKDAFVRWQWHDDHFALMGIAPPPVIDLSEEVWGYRGLEAVLVDIAALVSSRDVGLMAGGNLNPDGSLRYGIMFANNSNLLPERDRYKRIYGQIQARTGPWIAGIGANYAGYDDFRDNALMFNGVLGRVADGGRIGIDWYVQMTTFANDESLTHGGISLFGEFPFSSEWALVGRIDRFAVPVPLAGTQQYTLGLGGIAYRPVERVRIVPNVYWLAPEDAGHDHLHLRLTVIAAF